MTLSNSFRIKSESHKIVLNTIRQYQEISGAQLSRITKYKPSTLVYILRTLKKKGFIEISRIGKSTPVGGKPPTLWRLVANKGYVIGLEVLPHEIRTTVIDFSSTIISQNIDTFGKHTSPGEEISQLSEFIRHKITELQLPQEKIIGIGIAFTGLVDQKNGTIYFSESFGITNFNFQEILEQQLSVPVRIANDANAGALGMKWYHKGEQKLPSNIVFLTINEAAGLGTGLILDNQLYDGTSGTAGEVMTRVPKIGVLAEQGIKKYGTGQTKLDISRKDDLTIAEVAEYARNGCQISAYILETIGRILVKIFRDIIGLLNPGLIVIGGDFSFAQFIIDGYIKPHLEKECHEFFQAGLNMPQIQVSEFGIYSVSAGATALLIEEVFS